MEAVRGAANAWIAHVRTDGLFVTRLVVMGVMIASVNTDVALTIVKNAMAKETANTNAAIVKHAWTARASLLVTVIATEIVSVVMNASIAGVHVPAGHVAILIVIHCTASAVMRIAIVNPSVTQIPRPAVTVLVTIRTLKNVVVQMIITIYVTLMKLAVMANAVTLRPRNAVTTWEETMMATAANLMKFAVKALAAKTGNAASMANVSTLYAIIVIR